MRYIGIDLAWSDKGITGIAVLDGDGNLLDHALLIDLHDIAKFVCERAGSECLVGIDAPLIVKNEVGCRKCDRELARRGVRIFPANRSWLALSDGRLRGEVLVEMLAEKGFELTDSHPRNLGPGRYVYEVYPRSVLHYHLFDRKAGRTKIPSYKRARGVGLERAREGIIELRDVLKGLELPIGFDFGNLTYPVRDEYVRTYGWKEIKALGDVFDAILSAYAVYSADTFGYLGGEIVGDLEEGYILAPPDIRALGDRDA